MGQVVQSKVDCFRFLIYKQCRYFLIGDAVLLIHIVQIIQLFVIMDKYGKVPFIIGCDNEVLRLITNIWFELTVKFQGVEARLWDPVFTDGRKTKS